jgi:hypothetical protein
MKTTILPLKNSMNRAPFRLALLLIPLALACFALSPQARATCQEGCDTTNLNTFLGDDALLNNASKVRNTAVGFEALYNNVTSGNNTAIGYEALYTNDGWGNTGVGSEALYSNTDGAGNTAVGASALQYNVGFDNTAIGGNALVFSTTGYGNTACGRSALQNNGTGSNNTASGVGALEFNSTGSDNTAIGFYALEVNSGSRNIALGYQAGKNLTTGSNNIDIDNVGAANESNKIRIGTNGIHTATFIAGISGVTVANGVGVIIDARGHLGTVVSSERFKDEIKPMDKTSEAILALKPVTFRYKPELDPDGVPQFGLVAEEVEKVNRDLVARDAQGKPYTVRYEAVNAMLLNEFIKEHRKVEEQEATITQLKKDCGATIARLTTRLDEQASQIQKVCAQLELGKPAAQTVNNNQ